MPTCRQGTAEWYLLRELARHDLYFLLRYILKRKDIDHPWLIARCKEVQDSPNGHLDLWAREHFKSTIITFGKTVQDVLASHGEDPLPCWHGRELTVGILSYSRPSAKGFLRQIKFEFEGNAELKNLFPDILWSNPGRDAPKWSEDDGLIVRRQSNPKEATIEAWGLVDGQPIGKHWLLRVYDDVVVRDSVNTPEQIGKTTEMWELSINLGADGGYERYIGTRYAIMDTYQTMIERGVVNVRLYPATEDGTETGKPVLISQAALDKKRRSMGPATFSAQMLQRPVSAATATFQAAHLRMMDVRPATLAVAIMCDPAHSRRRGSDSTAMAVVGIDAQRNKYLLDGFNHKMALKERWTALRDLRKKWMAAPGVQAVVVGYERYGLQSDLEHFEERMAIEKISFDIQELAWPREGPGSKADRIQRLYPDFATGKFYIPSLVYRDGIGLAWIKLDGDGVRYEAAKNETTLMKRMADSGQKWRILRPIKRTNHEGRLYDVTVDFIVQYLAHPAPGMHDDLIDAVSRFYDMDINPPVIIEDRLLEPEVTD